MTKSCAIYVIGPARLKTPMKIGIAFDVASRLLTLQCGNWLALRLYDHMWVKSQEAAYSLEYQTHKLLRSKHITGEWFRVTSEVAYEAIEISADKLGLHMDPWKDYFSSSLTFIQEYAEYEKSFVKIAPAGTESV